MERRVLLAIFLAFLVLYAWQALFVKPVPKPGQPGSAQSQTTQPQPGLPTPAGAQSASPATEASTPGAVAAPNPAAEANATSPAATPLVGDTGEHDLRVETPQVIAVFTNRGARLKSWRLKRYHDQR